MKRTAFLLTVGVGLLALGLCGTWAANGQEPADALRLLQAENTLLKATMTQRDKEIESLKKEIESSKALTTTLLEKLRAKSGVATTPPVVGPTTPESATQPQAERGAFVPDYSLPTSLGVAERVGKHFGEILWGTDIKNIVGMQRSLNSTLQDFRTKFGEANLIKFIEGSLPGSRGVACLQYTRSTDRMSIGQARVEEIKYHFYRGRFYNVMVTFKGMENWKLLKSELTTRYGPCTGGDGLKMSVWAFSNSKTSVSSPPLAANEPWVTMGLVWDPSQSCGFLTVVCNPIFEEVLKDLELAKKDIASREGNTTSDSGTTGWQLLADANLASSKGEYDKAIVLLERLLSDKTIDSNVRLLATSVLATCHSMKRMGK